MARHGPLSGKYGQVIRHDHMNHLRMMVIGLTEPTLWVEPGTGMRRLSRHADAVVLEDSRGFTNEHPPGYIMHSINADANWIIEDE